MPYTIETTGLQMIPDSGFILTELGIELIGENGDNLVI